MFTTLVEICVLLILCISGHNVILSLLGEFVVISDHVFTTFGDCHYHPGADLEGGGGGRGGLDQTAKLKWLL